MKPKVKRATSYGLIAVSFAVVLVVTALTGCGGDDSRANNAEQRAAVEARLRQAAEQRADNERSRSERNYALAVGGFLSGIVMLVVGTVAGVWLAMRTKRDFVAQWRQQSTINAAPEPLASVISQEVSHVEQ